MSELQKRRKCLVGRSYGGHNYIICMSRSTLYLLWYRFRHREMIRYNYERTKILYASHSGLTFYDKSGKSYKKSDRI